MSAQDSTVPRDQSRTPVWWGVSSVDGVTPVPISIDGTTGHAKVELGTSTTPVMANLTGSLPVDGNRVSCLGGVSNTDGTVVIPVSVNPATGAILGQIS